MKTTNLGRSGLKVSRICLGMMTCGGSAWRPWVLDEDAARPIVRRAAELGDRGDDGGAARRGEDARGAAPAAAGARAPVSERVRT
jgi:hypothetical protein